MKKKNIISVWMMAALLAGSMASCISDDSSEGGQQLPSLTVKGAGAADMQVYNFDLGTDCVITPDINYTGGDEADLKYEWQIGTYVGGQKGELSVVSTDRTLNYKFEKGGSYYAHLNVTDGRVGKTVDYQININRTFEKGFVISSTDANGDGNLVFIKTLTPEEEQQGQSEKIFEHSFEMMNPGLSEKGLVGAATSTVTWPKTLTRLLMSTQDRCYILDPNNFTVLADIDYSELYPGFKADRFCVDQYNPYAYDTKMRRFAYVNITYMFAYENASYAKFQPADVLSCKYKGFYGNSYETLYPDYEKNMVTGYDAYASYYGREPFVTTEGLLDGHQLITPFLTYAIDDNTYRVEVYLMTRREADDAVCLWTTTTSTIFSKDDFQTCKVFTPTATTAIPAQGAKVVGSPTYKRMFYAIGNRVYVYLPNATSFTLPDQSQYAIAFGDNEEVTFIDTDFDTEELYVATYDKTTRRGSFYVYDCKDVRTDNSGSVQPLKAYKNCAGRITSVFYKSSIQ